jgi:hypothetical protein
LIDAIATNSFVRVPELRREVGSWGASCTGRVSRLEQTGVELGKLGRRRVKLGVTIVLGVNKLGSSNE